MAHRGPLRHTENPITSPQPQHRLGGALNGVPARCLPWALESNKDQHFYSFIQPAPRSASGIQQQTRSREQFQHTDYGSRWLCMSKRPIDTKDGTRNVAATSKRTIDICVL